MGEEALSLIEEWKKEIGEIPENTCPHIDKCIKQIESFEKDIDYIKRNKHKYESVEEILSDLPDFGWESPIDILNGKLRKDNEKLRELGIFWYEKCEELIELFTKEERKT